MSIVPILRDAELKSRPKTFNKFMFSTAYTLLLSKVAGVDSTEPF